jgi:RHS repeat-associated protein
VNSYTYDALGRISTLTYSLNGVSTTEVYTWTGWTLLYRELMQNGAAIEKYRYTWGLDVSGTLEGAGGVGGLLAIERNVNNNYSWDIRYPHYDANGNIMALSNSSGQISARYRYDAFGKTILSTDVDGTGWNTKNIHGFSTKPTLGNHKLHYYGYRWYDASNGRWINRDPIEEKGGLNLYGFVGNDGVGMWDLLGLANSVVVGTPSYINSLIQAGWSAANIAAQLGISIEAAQALIDKAREEADRKRRCKEHEKNKKQGKTENTNQGKCRETDCCDVAKAKLASWTLEATARWNELQDKCLKSSAIPNHEHEQKKAYDQVIECQRVVSIVCKKKTL